MVRVSVVIPSFNHEKYIEECINSILNQTFQDFEIVITDDGSKDQTVEVIKGFNDPRIKLFVHETNKGACTAANNCIKNSTGEYIAMISSDDAFLPDKLQKQVDFLDNSSEIAAVFGKPLFIDENSNEITLGEESTFNVFNQPNRTRAEWLNRFFFEGNCLCHPTMLIRRECYNQAGLYNERFANLPDFDMWVRLCLKYDIHIMDDKLIKFRLRADEANASGNKPSVHIRNRFEYKQILNHYLDIKDKNLFLQVFPDSDKYGQVETDLIPYFLAMHAIETGCDFRQLWGLETLYKFIQNENTAIALEKHIGFSYINFIQLTGKHDVFKIIPPDVQPVEPPQLPKLKGFKKVKKSFKEIVLGIKADKDVKS